MIGASGAEPSIGAIIARLDGNIGVILHGMNPMRRAGRCLRLFVGG